MEIDAPFPHDDDDDNDSDGVNKVFPKVGQEPLHQI